MDVEKFYDRELIEMQRKCVYLTQSADYKELYSLKDIFLIALQVINGELDARKIRKEGE